MGVVGIVVLLGIALLLSSGPPARAQPADLRVGPGAAAGDRPVRAAHRARARACSRWSNDAANSFIGFANAGIRFVFGDWPAVAIVQAPGLGPEQGALRT